MDRRHARAKQLHGAGMIISERKIGSWRRRLEKLLVENDKTYARAILKDDLRVLNRCEKIREELSDLIENIGRFG